MIKEEVIKDKLTQKPIDLNFVLKLWNLGYNLLPHKETIRENIENGLNGKRLEVRSFLSGIKLDGFLSLYSIDELAKASDEYIIFLRSVFGKNFSEILLQSAMVREEIGFLLFMDIPDMKLINRISSWDSILSWCDVQKIKPAQILDFVKNYIAVADFKKENILDKFSFKVVADAIKVEEESEQYKLLKSLPDDYTRNIIMAEFKGTYCLRSPSSAFNWKITFEGLCDKEIDSRLI